MAFVFGLAEEFFIFFGGCCNACIGFSGFFGFFALGIYHFVFCGYRRNQPLLFHESHAKLPSFRDLGVTYMSLGKYLAIPWLISSVDTVTAIS